MELLSTYALKRKIAKIRRIKTQVKKMTFFQALHENSVKSSTLAVTWARQCRDDAEGLIVLDYLPESRVVDLDSSSIGYFFWFSAGS